MMVAPTPRDRHRRNLDPRDQACRQTHRQREPGCSRQSSPSRTLGKQSRTDLDQRFQQNRFIRSPGRIIGIKRSSLRVFHTWRNPGPVPQHRHHDSALQDQMGLVIRSIMPIVEIYNGILCWFGRIAQADGLSASLIKQETAQT